MEYLRPRTVWAEAEAEAEEVVRDIFRVVDCV